MEIKNNFSLKQYNTYQVECMCKYFAIVKTILELKQVLESEEFKRCTKYLILGGGSNLLLATNKYNGFVIKIEIKGITRIKKGLENQTISFGAGEIWDDCVKYCAIRNLGGIENMAYIPGTVGGAAVQNIAAYDQNIEETFYKLKAINSKTLEKKTFYKKDCNFEYRNSRFKKDKNPWIVINVSLTLSENSKIDTKYFETGLNKTSLHQELELIAKPPYTLIDMYNAVVSLRKKRIPNEKEFPNPGSFFKNPVISKEKYLEIKKEIPNLQFYPTGKVKYIKNNKVPKTDVKISYGQLFDLSLKVRGFVSGNVGVHEKNAAFIYNNGNATGLEIKKFSEELKKKIYKKYKIKLEEEVRVIK